MKNTIIALFAICMCSGFANANHDLDRARNDLDTIQYRLHDLLNLLERSSISHDRDVRDAIYAIEGARRELSDAERALERADRGGRVVTVSHEDKGGTSHGDRSAACGKARERALAGAESQCRGRGGYSISHYFSPENYYRGGTGHVCRVTANVQCQLR